MIGEPLFLLIQKDADVYNKLAFANSNLLTKQYKNGILLMQVSNS